MELECFQNKPSIKITIKKVGEKLQTRFSLGDTAGRGWTTGTRVGALFSNGSLSPAPRPPNHAASREGPAQGTLVSSPAPLRNQFSCRWAEAESQLEVWVVGACVPNHGGGGHEEVVQ